MKFTPQHLAILKAGINRVLAKNPTIIEQYQTGQFTRSERVKDLQKRFCWDLFWATGFRIGDGVGMDTNCGITGDYHDDHIFTALKSVCPKVVRQY
jgi:hypothetical protein